MGVGTKEVFRSFLNLRGSTYTAYRKLKPEVRKTVLEEYEKWRKGKREAVAACGK